MQNFYPSTSLVQNLSLSCLNNLDYSGDKVRGQENNLNAQFNLKWRFKDVNLTSKHNKRINDTFAQSECFLAIRDVRRKVLYLDCFELKYHVLC